MSERILSKIHKTGYSAYAEYEPVNKCPICKHAIRPTLLEHKIYIAPDEKSVFCTLNLCEACYKTFISTYRSTFTPNILANNPNIEVYLEYCAPEMFVPSTFEELISNNFSSFVQIYNEAEQAEHYTLKEVSGIGYRKALEFLIKEFLILKNPNDEDKIAESPLMKCIKTYIDNPQLLTACTRAVWLGNDQTHFVQKFDDKDIGDLKKLIRLTVHWISLILETDEAEKIQPH